MSNKLVLLSVLLVSASAIASQTTPAPTPLSGDSIYNADSTWTDQDGKSTPLSSLKGKIVVVAMVYTSCQGACPMTISDLKRIEKGLSDEAKKETRFAVFSFDTKRDTPTKLREFARARSLDPARWTLFHGKAVAVRKLAALLGIRYKRDSSGDFDHSNVISVLDRSGAIALQQNGLGQDPENTIKKINELVREPAK